VEEFHSKLKANNCNAQVDSKIKANVCGTSCLALAS